MRDADWLDPTDDDLDRDGPRRARPLLFAVAGVPWLVVIALLALPGRLGADDPPPRSPVSTDTGIAPEGSDLASTPSDPPPSDPPPDPSGIPTGDPSPSPSVPEPGSAAPTDTDELVTPEGRELRGGWRVEPGPEEAVALAVVAARSWLTGVAPVLDLGPSPGDRRADHTYAEHLVVEAVEQPASDAVVVSLVAVVLDTDESLAPAVRRLAVPVALTAEGPRLAGAPWDLPPPVLDPVRLARQPTHDEAELERARTALKVAGLTELDLVALHHTAGWPVIAEVATAGSETTTEVWLRPHLDGFVVAGSTLAGADRTERNGEHP